MIFLGMGSSGKNDNNLPFGIAMHGFLSDNTAQKIFMIKEQGTMANNTYSMIELVGTSTQSIEDAVKNALSSKTLQQQARWFQIIETRGAIKDGAVQEWQVTIKVGLKLEA